MARAQCPFPERFRVYCFTRRYVYQRGYVEDWIECEAKKENGWYRFYEVKMSAAGRMYLAGEFYHPIRWKELQIALDRGIDIRMAEFPTEDEVIPDLGDLI